MRRTVSDSDVVCSYLSGWGGTGGTVMWRDEENLRDVWCDLDWFGSSLQVIRHFQSWSPRVTFALLRVYGDWWTRRSESFDESGVVYHSMKHQADGRCGILIHRLLCHVFLVLPFASWCTVFSCLKACAILASIMHYSAWNKKWRDFSFTIQSAHSAALDFYPSVFRLSLGAIHGYRRPALFDAETLPEATS